MVAVAEHCIDGHSVHRWDQSLADPADQLIPLFPSRLQNGVEIRLHPIGAGQRHFLLLFVIPKPSVGQPGHEDVYVFGILEHVPQRVRGWPKVFGLRPLPVGIQLMPFKEHLFAVQEAPKRLPDLLSIAVRTFQLVARMVGRKSFPLIEILVPPVEELLANELVVLLEG